MSHCRAAKDGDAGNASAHKWDDVILFVTQDSDVGPDFPRTLAGVRLVAEEQFASNCLVTVPLRELSAICVPLTVLVHVKHGTLENLKRCSHYNGKMVAIQRREMVDEAAWVDSVTKTPAIALEVRFVDTFGEPFGKSIKVDSSKFFPKLTMHDEAALRMLKLMTKMWTTLTEVVLLAHPERIEIQRLTNEYWANKKAFGKKSTVFSILCATISIDLVGLGAYLNSFRMHEDDCEFKVENPAIRDKVTSFLNCRLAGTDLDAECMCMEPVRSHAHMRLGCACGEHDGVKGAVVHVKCGMKWLLEQETNWETSFDAFKKPCAEGMDFPTCPYCVSRLMGTAPYVLQLSQNVDAEVISEVTPSLLYDGLRFMLLNKTDTIPFVLQHLIESGSNLVRVDERPEMQLNLPDGRRMPFPTAYALFSSLGNGGHKEDCVMPKLAKALLGQEESVKKDVQYYNNFLYYAALACELRYTTQCINWEPAESQND